MVEKYKYQTGLQQIQKGTFSHILKNDSLVKINGQLPEMSALKDNTHWDTQFQDL